MKKGQIQALFQQFESICYDYKGIECWSARELQLLLAAIRRCEEVATKVRQRYKKN